MRDVCQGEAVYDTMTAWESAELFECMMLALSPSFCLASGVRVEDMIAKYRFFNKSDFQFAFALMCTA